MARTKQLVTAANAWRDQYNPLRGLGMSQAVSLLESMNAGTFTDLMWVYKHIEETDPTGLALVERTVSALEELDYDVRMVPPDKYPRGYDEKLAQDQRDFLAARYEQLENLNEVVNHMALGFFRKLAFGQILPGISIDDTWRIECLDQWNFVRDRLKGPFYWNPKAESVMHSQLGEPLDKKRDRLVMLEYDRHVDRYGLIKFIRQNLAEKDWDGFIEVFGFDQTIVILPEGVPEGKRDEFIETASDISNGGNGALPSGTTVDHGNDSRGAQPFKPRLEWLQQQHVLAGTAGMLTMLTQAGSGTLAGGAHSDTWRTLSRARGKRISEVLQADVDKHELAVAFPGKPILAYFTLVTNEEQDVGDVVKHAVEIRTAFPTKTMDPDQFQEKTGYTLIDFVAAPVVKPEDKPADDAPVDKTGQVQSREGTMFARLRRLFGREPSVAEVDRIERRAGTVNEQLQESAMQALGKAAAQDLHPLFQRIADALQLDDDAMIDELIAIYNESPDLMEAIAANPATDPVIAEIITAAIINGVAETLATHQVEDQS